MGGWDITVPTCATNIVDIPEVHGENWYAFEETLNEQHYGFSSALSGRHIPAYTPVITAGATSAITAITGAASGALGWDTERGVTWFYDGSSWVLAHHQIPHSSVIVHMESDYTMGPGDYYSQDFPMTIPFDTEDYDSLGEWNSYAFTASADGYYLLLAKLSVSSVGGTLVGFYMSVRTSADAQYYKTGEFEGYVLSSQEFPIIESSIVYLTAGMIIRPIFYKDGTKSVVIEGGADRSFFKIYKVSG